LAITDSALAVEFAALVVLLLWPLLLHYGWHRSCGFWWHVGAIAGSIAVMAIAIAASAGMLWLVLFLLGLVSL